MVPGILSLLDLSFANLLKDKGKYLSVMDLAFSLANKSQLKQESKAPKKWKQKGMKWGGLPVLKKNARNVEARNKYRHL